MATTGELWGDFCCQAAFTRAYDTIAQSVGGGMPHRNPYLDEVLPGLLLLRAAAILEHALDDLVGDGTLATKIKRLRQRHSPPLDVAAIDALDAVRMDRNVVAHETPGTISWTEFEQGVAAIEVVLSVDFGSQAPGRPTLRRRTA